MPTDAASGRSIARPALPNSTGPGGLTFGRGAYPLRPVVVVAVLAVASSRAAGQYREMRGAVSARLTTAQLMNVADQHASLAMSVTLQLQHREELQALIAAQHRSDSSQYHQWLSPEEFAARFGVAPDSYAALAERLRSQGFTVRTWPSRSRIDFAGTVSTVEAAFRVRMNSYRHRGRYALANANPPRLPDQFAGSVQSLRLNTFRLAEPVVRVVTPDGPATLMGPSDIYTAYDVASVLHRGIDGTGQTVPGSQCPSIGAAQDGQVTIDKLLQATNRAFTGC